MNENKKSSSTQIQGWWAKISRDWNSYRAIEFSLARARTNQGMGQNCEWNRESARDKVYLNFLETPFSID